MEYLIDGEIVDTYGGNYTFRDVWYEIENGETIFYQRYYGAKPEETSIITDTQDIKYYKTLINI